MPASLTPVSVLRRAPPRCRTTCGSRSSRGCGPRQSPSRPSLAGATAGSIVVARLRLTPRLWVCVCGTSLRPGQPRWSPGRRVPVSQETPPQAVAAFSLQRRGWELQGGTVVARYPITFLEAACYPTAFPEQEELSPFTSTGPSANGRPAVSALGRPGLNPA